VRTTLATKGENNGNLWNNLRDQYSKWTTRNHNVTSAAKNIFKKEIDKSLNQRVELGANEMYFVTSTPKTTYTS
jgi:hypothetical protein